MDDKLWNLSYTFNTDGCKASDNSKASVWPIYLMLHDLPSYLRQKFMIVAGLWVAKSEPYMNVFLQPFIEQANHLSQNGFELNHERGKSICKLFPLGCCVDSVARCAMLNMKQYNGIFGCTYCEHPSVNINDVRKYPMLPDVPKNRTDSRIKKQMCEAMNSSKDVVGVWGPSCLMNLKHFDLVKGMVLDFLHACLLGVTKLHCEIITSRPKQDYYVGSPAKVAIIDSRLLSIKPPTCVGKVPRSFNERRNWKGSEWLPWLLFYSIPCLKNLIPKKYLRHIALFGTAMNILLRDSISLQMLQTASKLLIEYVFLFEKYFGKESMNYNVHLLLHITDSVKNWGPLWADSTFPFENENKNVLKMKNSNHQIAKQIVTKLLVFQQIPDFETKEFISDKVKEFCKNMEDSPLKNVCKINNCYLLGSNKEHALNDEEIECLKKLNVNNIVSVRKYNKLIYNKCRYSTSTAKNCKKTKTQL
uniref:DUF4218 domain-containing protein n=1 Tax=Trichogramma kaykai TaxID=54128 RepID=A0ABD2VUC2_9HYME